VFLKVVDPYRLARSGCVNKQMIAQIDTDVRERMAHGIKKHQVTCLEFILGYRRAGLTDFAGSARQYQAHALTEHVADKARAVKASLGFVAATTVADADQVLGAINDLLNAVAIV
jgi:tryptophan 2,3-dioxygenase